MSKRSFNAWIEFRGGYSLWPEYDAHSLKWLLTFMERMHAGAILRKVVLRNDRQKILGWYVYYLKPDAVGQVVQIGGERQFTKDILDHLLYDAWAHGAIAVHGALQSRLDARLLGEEMFLHVPGRLDACTFPPARNPRTPESR